MPSSTAPLRILVTGAGGMLARDLVPQLRAAGHQVTAMGRADLDVTDPGECIAGVAGHDVVVNAAAYTAVDAAETDEARAFDVNAVGAANLARACTHAGARMVQISTDYVFDGMATEPYAVEPPHRATLGLRSHQGGRRVGRAGTLRRPLDRAHRLALRARRPQLRLDHAATGR